MTRVPGLDVDHGAGRAQLHVRQRVLAQPTWDDRLTCRCDAGVYFDETHLLGSGLPCKACPRYQTTLHPGATEVAAHVCDEAFNTEA